MSPGYDSVNNLYFGDVIDEIDLQQANEYDTVLVGEPFDGGQLSTRGAARGPAGIREALLETRPVHIHSGLINSVGDLGDIDFPWGTGVRRVHEYIQKVATSVHETNTFPIFIGGGHDLAYPNIRPLIDVCESVCVVNFDAHFDLDEVTHMPRNGTPFWQLYEEGLDHYIVVGARHYETNVGNMEYMQETGGTIITAEEVGKSVNGTISTINEEIQGFDCVYISCDLDVLDISVAPGTTVPIPGGIQSRELYECLRSVISDPSVEGFELIGNAPPLESQGQRLNGANLGKTSMAGARALAHVMTGVQQQKESH